MKAQLIRLGFLIIFRNKKNEMNIVHTNITTAIFQIFLMSSFFYSIEKELPQRLVNFRPFKLYLKVGKNLLEIINLIFINRNRNATEVNKLKNRIRKLENKNKKLAKTNTELANKLDKK